MKQIAKHCHAATESHCHAEAARDCHAEAQGRGIPGPIFDPILPRFARQHDRHRASLTRCLLLVASLLLSGPLQASIRATVDRANITTNDLLSLTLRIQGQADGRPDLAPLRIDFDVVDTSRTNTHSTTIINGVQTSEFYTDWIIYLRPKKTGQLIIPPLTYRGEQSNPILIRVRKAARTRDALVFFETTIDDKETYVQSQLIYTVRLFYTDSVSGDFPKEPVLENVLIETIEEERRFQSIVNNRRYHVLEKRYAIYPQKSGELNLPAEVFRGEIRSRRGLFSSRERVNAVSTGHRIRVKPKPAGFTGDYWLPARSLSISESWSVTPPEFKVGDPINRTLTLTATGIARSIIPPFAELKLDNAKTYPDPAATAESIGNLGITATRTETIGIVPTEEGELVLPEIRIPWWNTEADRMEIAILPEQTYVVGAGDFLNNVIIPELPRPDGEQIVQQTSSYWLYIAIAVMLVWMLTIYQWLTTRRELILLQQVEEEQKTIEFQRSRNDKSLWRNFANACKDNDPALARAALIDWSSHRWPNSNIGTLADLQPLMNSKKLDTAIADLNQTLFGFADSKAWRGNDLSQAVTSIKNTDVDASKRAQQSLIAQLNPS